MKPILKGTMLLMLMAMCGCADEISEPDFSKTQYYSKEVLPQEYLGLYGEWNLYHVSGGFHGGGYTPVFNTLLIEPYGIYKLWVNDTVLESGKIETDTFDMNNREYLQIKFIPENQSDNILMYPPEKYIVLKGDTLHMNSPCCDMYNYHFNRID